MLITENEQDINKIVNNLRRVYQLKALGDIRYYLGINIEKTKPGTYI